MILLQLAGTLVTIIGLMVFYYLMALSKHSPQKLLGPAFRMPDVRMRYTPDALYRTFGEAGESGRPEMRRYWLYDCGLMACLTGVMIAVSANVAGKGSWVYLLMIALSVARTAVDIAEDFLFLYLLRRYPERLDGTARLAGAVTTLKHALLAAWLGMLFLLLLQSAFGLDIL
jgi:hypothetical protein